MHVLRALRGRGRMRAKRKPYAIVTTTASFIFFPRNRSTRFHSRARSIGADLVVAQPESE